MKKIPALLLSMLLLLSCVGPLSAHAAEIPAHDSLDAYIEEEFQKTHIPGMSVQIVSADEVLFAETYGDCESLDSAFILGSISKSFTAAAIMQLAEQGRLDLDAPMADYLPEVKQSCRTTVRQLLNQTSGIKTYDTLETYDSSDTPAPYQYANVNYNLLGKIVEQVSELDYGSYVEQNIFAPLGMEHSYTSLEEARTGGLTAGYRNYFGLMIKQGMPYPSGNIEGWLTLPSAYLISSANDMGKYLQAYLKDGAGFLGAASVNTMFYDSVEAAPDYQYGMGWGLDNRGDEPILWHGGNVENYTTAMFLLPERGLAAIVLTNACDYFVANGMAVQLPYNIVYKLLGQETQDIQESTYLTSHLVIDGVLFLALLLSLLPLIFLRRWFKKHRDGVSKPGVVWAILLHAALPTLLLVLFPVLGLPISVVSGFAPDIFLVTLTCGAVLYLTGAVKLAFRLRRRKVK